MPPTKQPQDHRKSRKTTRQSTAQTVPTPEEFDEGDYSPTVWGNDGEGALVDMTVPSGQRCLVRRPGVEGLMKEGILHDLDSLSSIVQKKTQAAEGKGKPVDVNAEVSALLKDQESMVNILHTVDRVVAHCVVKPSISMTPNDVTRRKKGVIYADMVDLVDKMFILQYVVGGTRDLEKFRSEFYESMGSLAALQGVQPKAE